MAVPRRESLRFGISIHKVHCMLLAKASHQSAQIWGASTFWWDLQSHIAKGLFIYKGRILLKYFSHKSNSHGKSLDSLLGYYISTWHILGDWVLAETLSCCGPILQMLPHSKWQVREEMGQEKKKKILSMSARFHCLSIPTNNTFKTLAMASWWEE